MNNTKNEFITATVTVPWYSIPPSLENRDFNALPSLGCDSAGYVDCTRTYLPLSLLRVTLIFAHGLIN